AFCLITALALLPAAARADDPQPTLKSDSSGTLQSDVENELAKTSGKQFLTFNVENDLFGGGTDRNYTSGVRVTWFDASAKPPAIFDNISKIFPTFTINDTTSVYYTAGQNLYTPKDITSAVQDPRDRPWAAFLYGAAG